MKNVLLEVNLQKQKTNFTSVSLSFSFSTRKLLQKYSSAN